MSETGVSFHYAEKIEVRPSVRLAEKSWVTNLMVSAGDDERLEVSVFSNRPLAIVFKGNDD